MARKQKASEEFCYSCERLLLTENEKLGPVCKDCFKKTKRRDPLMKAALRQAVVAIVPIVCPHDQDRKHRRCKYGRATACYFNVIVLDKDLEPIEITGPYTAMAAERAAKRVRNRRNREK